MKHAPKWASRPVFVSSTFQDMQAERDHLRNFVFPEIEERLRARGRYLEWVDLRIGVAGASLGDEAERELQVLKVCLDEVRRCRPFLIVLLGDRYASSESVRTSRRRTIASRMRSTIKGNSTNRKTSKQRARACWRS